MRCKVPGGAHSSPAVRTLDTCEPRWKGLLMYGSLHTNNTSRVTCHV